MRKFFKIVLYTFASFLLLVILLFGVAYWNRDALLEKINEQLNEGIHGEVHIGKLDFTLLNNFPHFSLTLHDVYLRDSLFSLYHKDFFTSKKIFLDINLYQLFHKQISVKELTIENANIFIFRAKEGYTNLNLFKTEEQLKDSLKKEENPFLLSVRNVEFKNVHVKYADSLKNKSHSFQFINTKHEVVSNDSIYDAHIAGAMHFDGLTFNSENGSFLTGKSATVDLYVNVNRLTRTLIIAPSSLLFEKSMVALSGGFDLKPGGDFNLTFASEQIDLSEGKSLLDKHLNHSLRKFEVDQPVSVKVDLVGKNIPGDKPQVDVKFGSSKANACVAKLSFSDLTFEGSFTNHVDQSKPSNDDNSKVSINKFEGMMDWIPVKGDVTITELKDPLIDLNLLTEMRLHDLNSHLDTTRFKFTSGEVTTEIKYYGKLSEYLNVASTEYKGQLHGKSVVKNGTFNFFPRKLQLDKLNGAFEFDKQKFSINSLAFDVNGSPLQIKGTVNNFVPFFIQPKNKGYIKLDVTSPRFDLTQFATKKIAGHKTSRQIKQDRKKISDLMDGLFEKLEFDLNVKVDQLAFKEFKATDFSGRMTLTHNSLIAKPVTMQVAGGIMNLDFTLANLTKSVNPMTVTAKITNARIKEFFQSFSNFNQNTIGDKNLAGTITANVKFNAKVDDNLNVLAPSMVGNIDCKIRNGKLTNFEPLENMSNFLFKKRDFSDVDFAELNSHFTLQGTDLDISRMEIQSTVLTFFVHGRYSFTDSTSLSVQLPLSNLKKRDKTYKPKNVGVDAKVGPSIFLHIYKDEEGKIAIAYDPFKKWAKQR